MKNLSQRERIMVTGLPAGVILLVYFFFFARPAAGDLNELRRQVDVSSGRVPTARAQSEAQSDVVRLQGELREKQSLNRSLESNRGEFTAFWSDADARARSGEYLGDLLSANGVILLEEEVAGPDDQKQFASALAALPDTELWKLRLAGTYQQVRDVLAGLGPSSELPLLPVAIEMRPVVHVSPSIRIWNLWICR